MDPIVIAVVVVVVMPIAVVWALSKSASLRGPLPRPESHKPVEALVTDVVPEEHPDPDDEDGGGAEPLDPPRQPDAR